MDLNGKCVLLGVTGGIAAYKMANVASALRKLGADVEVIMTRNATQFITPITFETLTGHKCMVDTFDRDFKFEVTHIALAKKADVILVAPATANVIAKMAHGIADDMLTTTVLAAKCPKLVSPAMNTGMLQGFNGVQNFPTVGLIDGVFRKNLEETGMGYGLEVEMIRKAHELDMLTCPYVFDPEQAKAMAEAGADILVAHMGLTTKGTIGAKTALTLDDCVDKIKAIIAAGRSVRPDIMVICHGGPIAEPDDAAYIIHKIPEIDGFFGASSIERFAAERGIKAQAAAFKAITK